MNENKNNRNKILKFFANSFEELLTFPSLLVITIFSWVYGGIAGFNLFYYFYDYAPMEDTGYLFLNILIQGTWLLILIFCVFSTYYIAYGFANFLLESIFKLMEKFHSFADKNSEDD